LEFGAVGCKVGAKLEEFGAPTAFVLLLSAKERWPGAERRNFRITSVRRLRGFTDYSTM
jgi:hypothetical protein